VKIVNGADTPANITIRLAGLSPDAPMKAVKTVLSGPDADAVNEDAKEPVIKPIQSTELVKSVFTYEAPANSLTVYRINR